MVLLGLLLTLYGLAVIVIAIFKFPVVWNMGKIQFFVKKLGNTGTVIFFFIWGGAALGFGIYFLINNLPN